MRVSDIGEEMFIEDLPDYLARKRADLGWSLRKTAALSDTGVNQVKAVESRRKNVNLITLTRVMDALGVSFFALRMPLGLAGRSVSQRR